MSAEGGHVKTARYGKSQIGKAIADFKTWFTR